MFYTFVNSNSKNCKAIVEYVMWKLLVKLKNTEPQDIVFLTLLTNQINFKKNDLNEIELNDELKTI